MRSVQSSMGAASSGAAVDEQGQRLCVAAILGAFGVHGAVRVRSFTQSPAACFGYAPFWLQDKTGEDRLLTPLAWRAGGGGFIVEFKEVHTREQAETYRSMRLYVERTALPPLDGEDYYYADLVGLEVKNLQGRLLGHVQAVHNFGAGDVLDISSAKGAVWMTPFSKAAVLQVDLKAGLVLADDVGPDDHKTGVSLKDA